jgi:hypothetical protein
LNDIKNQEYDYQFQQKLLNNQANEIQKFQSQINIKQTNDTLSHFEMQNLEKYSSFEG